MSPTVRVIQYGLGPIGCAIARLVAERADLRLVGAVDVDSAKIGKDTGEVIGLGAQLGLRVRPNLAQALQDAPADLVVHATSSYFHSFREQILEILSTELDVVSTAEELAFPWLVHPEEAAEIHRAARQAGRTVLATGVNPGFVMDALPLFLTALCQQVNHIEVTRVVNASTRRGPFQLKIGAGMTVQAFQARVKSGGMGHVGLLESMGMLFDTLGKKLSRYDSQVEPLVAERPLGTDYVEVQPGQARGLKQVARGYTGEGEFASLTFVAALEAEAEGDTIRIEGRPSLEVRLQGTNGDLATAAIAVNAISRVRAASPGLVTMRDLPIVTAG